MEMTNEQKAARLDEMATALHGQANLSGLCASLNAEGSSRRAMHEGNQREQESDAALLREAAAMMREQKGISWTSEGHGMVLTSAVYRNRLMAIVGRTGRTFFWTVSRVAAREHEEFGTADSLEAAQAAAVAWVDEQEGR